MKTSIYALALVGLLTVSAAYADHDASCTKLHGKVTVVTPDMISVDGKPYKVGKSTLVIKDDHRVKTSEVKVGDTVCVDDRGKDDISNGEIAGLTVLSAATTTASVPVVKEKEIVREKVSYHDKNCPYAHARVTQVNGTTVIVNGQPLTVGENLIIMKNNEVLTVNTLKVGDVVCLHDENKVGVKEKVTTVYVLDPADSVLIPESKVIEREKIQIR